VFKGAVNINGKVTSHTAPSACSSGIYLKLTVLETLEPITVVLGKNNNNKYMREILYHTILFVGAYKYLLVLYIVSHILQSSFFVYRM
jgi:hypothetical protein